MSAHLIPTALAAAQPGRTRGAQSVGRAGLRQGMQHWGYSVRLWLRQAIAATQPLGLESEGFSGIGLGFVVNAEDYLD
jgi:hypothetical protein